MLGDTIEDPDERYIHSRAKVDQPTRAQKEGDGGCCDVLQGSLAARMVPSSAAAQTTEGTHHQGLKWFAVVSQQPPPKQSVRVLLSTAPLAT